LSREFSGVDSIEEKNFMTPDQLQLNAQRCLQEFDDAGDTADLDPLALGEKALEALDEFLDYWKDRSYMQGDRESQPSQNPLRPYAERQIEWAEREKQRVLDLMGRTNSYST
jgi:hypothetical protein